MTEPNKRGPGDLTLDHYMPDATAEEREEARANLKALAALIIDTNRELERRAVEKAIRASAMEDVESQT